MYDDEATTWSIVSPCRIGVKEWMSWGKSLGPPCSSGPKLSWPNSFLPAAYTLMRGLDMIYMGGEGKPNAKVPSLDYYMYCFIFNGDDDEDEADDVCSSSVSIQGWYVLYADDGARRVDCVSGDDSWKGSRSRVRHAIRQGGRRDNFSMMMQITT